MSYPFLNQSNKINDTDLLPVPFSDTNLCYIMNVNLLYFREQCWSKSIT